MPKLRKPESKTYHIGEAIEWEAMQNQRQVTLDDLERFFQVLNKYAMGPEAKELLFARFVERLSWDEITYQQGFTDTNAAKYYCRKLLKELRDRGISFPRE